MNKGDGVTVSVIVAVKDGARTLERCILSVIRQSHAPTDLVIVDGCSTDGTADIIQRHANSIGWWVTEPDKGIYDAWNKGLRHAKGDWIYFLGADDYLWNETVLEQMTDAIASSFPATRLTYGRVAVLNASGGLILLVGDPWAVAKKRLVYTMSLPHQGILLHRTWFARYGKFDLSYRITGDYEMLLRGWPNEEALFVPNVIVAGMAHGGISSKPQNAGIVLREIVRARKTHEVHSHRYWLAAAYLRLYTRQALQTLLGTRITYWLLDLGRRIFRKPPYWTRI